MTLRRHLRSAALCLGAAVLTLWLLGVALPVLGQRGYAGEVVRVNLEQGRDATPLFYSESERAVAIARDAMQRR